MALDSGRYGAVVLFTAAAGASPQLWPRVEQAARILGQRSGVASAVVGVLSPEQSSTIADLGCLVYEEPTHAIEAMAMLYRWGQALQHPDGAQTSLSLSAIQWPTQSRMNEPEGLALFAQFGLVAPPWSVAHSVEQAREIASRSGGGPFVLKVVSRDLPHKSDVGGVILNVSAATAAEAYERICNQVAQKAPDARIEGVILMQMVKPVLECMVGARYDPVFGPVLVFGLGGTEVEWLHRVTLLRAPAALTTIEAKLTALGIAARLEGWRGGPRIPLRALVSAIGRFSEFAASAGDRLVSAEVNPLMVTADGVYCADAVVQMHV